MAWKVTEGSFDGVDLSGLSVAAAVQGTTTFSEDKPEQARSVLIVDEKADAAPARRPWSRMAQEPRRQAAGERRRREDGSRISLKVEAHSMADDRADHAAHGMPHAPRASFWAAGLAQIVTRPLDDGDHFCGNEVVAYPPLSKGSVALPAYTLGHQFKGEGLDAHGTTRTAEAASSATSPSELKTVGRDSTSRPVLNDE